MDGNGDVRRVRIGAPLGTALYEKGGFGAVSLASTIAPLVTLVLIAPLRPALPAPRDGPGICLS